MYDIISAFQCYTISVDVYFPFHCTLWMACFTFLLILCYCCCAHDNDVSHTLHREWGVTLAQSAPSYDNRANKKPNFQPNRPPLPPPRYQGGQPQQNRNEQSNNNSQRPQV